jgi:hypothetical protein
MCSDFVFLYSKESALRMPLLRDLQSLHLDLGELWMVLAENG